MTNTAAEILNFLWGLAIGVLIGVGLGLILGGT